MDSATELSLQALSFYFSEVEVSSTNVLLIHCPPGNYLEHLKGSNITVVTHNATHADAWKAHRETDYTLNPEQHSNYDLVLHFGTKFQFETRATLGVYSKHLSDNGTWFTIAQNRQGAQFAKKQLSALFGQVESISKSKCKILRSEKTEAYQGSLATDWALLDSYTVIKGTSYHTTPGIFSADKIDLGSKLLAEYLTDQSWYGTGADFGAGYGFLSQQVLSKRHKIRELHLYELDQRALRAAELNLPAPDITHFHWCDITKGISAPRPFHWILMNPPFHTGGDTDFELGLQFLEQAHKHLKPGGKLYLVANLHLPYESTLHSLFRMVKPIGERDGFKCFEATK